MPPLELDQRRNVSPDGERGHCRRGERALTDDCPEAAAEGIVNVVRRRR